MNDRRSLLLALVVAALLAPQADARVTDEETIKSLEEKTVEVRPGKIILDSSELARQSYRDFLDLVSDDPELRAEAMRRLGDLELEATEAGQLAENIESLDARSFDNAVELYQTLLEAYPDYRRNDTVLYQLARAYEVGGRTDEALDVLNELVTRYPDTALIDEVQFRRGEMLFLRKNYNDAEMAYQDVVKAGEQSRFYEQSLYKLGWSRFRQEEYEPALDAFFTLLDDKLPPGTDTGVRVDKLSPAEQELLGDVFRAISLSFSYLDGADSINAWFARSGPRHYEERIYRNLAELYDSKQLYTDAATTRLALAERVAGSATAPRLYIEVIGIYRQAGFREPLMQTHAAFVERYAPDSDLWRERTPAELPDVTRQLESSLAELAQFHHAGYLEDGSADSYREAVHRYRSYLQLFPDADQVIEIHLQLAELLYARGDDALAVPEYEYVAYEYGEHPRAAESGLSAVQSCERLLQQAGSGDNGDRQRGCDAVAIRFVMNFPQHPGAATVLSRTGAGLLERQQAGEAARVCREILDRDDSVPGELRQAAWILLAQSRFSLQDYRGAEQAYREALAIGGLDADRRNAVSQAMATAIYRQAEQQQAQGERAAASRSFLRAAESAPDSSIQPVALYDAAASLLEEARWQEAAGVLQQFRAQHSGHELQAEATRKLAYAYAQDGRNLDAAAEYITLSGVHDDDAVRREALLQAADLYRQAGQEGKAVTVLEDYLRRYPQPPGQAMDAMQQLAEMEQARGNTSRHQYWLQSLIRADAQAGSDGRRPEKAARARLALADYRIAEFDRLGLGEPLQENLDRKLQAMEQAIDELEAAAGYGITDIITAATYRIGDLYHDLGRALLASQRPGDLAGEELARYNLLLEEEAAPFEEKAIEFHEANVRRIRAGQYDEWIASSLVQLGELWPARYARPEQTGIPAVAAAGRAAADPGYRQALTAMQNGQYAEAARMLNALESSARQSPRVRLTLATALVELGEDEAAERELLDVLATGPDDADARNLQGILYRRAGQFRQAREAYERALRLRPGYAMAHINLGILCDIYLQDAGCAMQHYREYLQLSADSDRHVSLWLADLEQRLGER